MAARSRPARKARLPKKRPAKKRVKAAAQSARRRAKAKTAKARAAKGKTAKGKTAKGKTAKAKARSVAPGTVEAALAAFAHEVRTPLTGILAISNLLATSELGERERRWVDTIKAGAEHLSSLATLFVDAARSRGAGEHRKDLFDLRALARSVGDSLAGRAAAKGLQASVEISDRLPALVIGDSVRLRAALENLVDNAVKFTDQGAVALAVTPARGGAGKAGIAFAVSDSGIGLTLKEIERLFRPFSQANVTIASRFGGAGLGLSSVKQLARAMGGDIMVASRKGGGTTFTLMVTLPLAKAAPAAAKAGAAPGVPLALRLLSVEDNPFGRVVLNAMLTELGHQAEYIGRGEAAPERLEQTSFDAVLMDMVLPGIDGIEAIRRIRALEPPLGRIAIIGISGRAEDEAAAREAGADAFLVKPVSPRALAIALLEATRRAAAAT